MLQGTKEKTSIAYMKYKNDISQHLISKIPCSNFVDFFATAFGKKAVAKSFTKKAVQINFSKKLFHATLNNNSHKFLKEVILKNSTIGPEKCGAGRIQIF